MILLVARPNPRSPLRPVAALGLVAVFALITQLRKRKHEREAAVAQAQLMEDLPLGLGVMSTTGFTLCCAALGAVGVAAALVAARGIAGVGRALCLGLGALNALLVLWYLFTLM